MAKHLARIHGTEEDKVNCPFYFKIGACRHADRCSRIHHRPAFSQTILIKHIYPHPVREAELNLLASGQDRTSASNSITNNNIQIDESKAREDFLVFFENFYEELSKFGHLEYLHICDNLGDHMVGHVYAKFSDEEEASDALNIMNGRYYNGKKLEVEFSPVTDFREARCRDFDEEVCSRGGFCNFMHAKPVPPCLIKDLEKDCEDERRRLEEEQEEERRREKRERERRKKRKREHRDREGRDRDRDREGRDRDRRKEKKRHRRSRSNDGENNDKDRGGDRSKSYSNSRSRSPMK
mmetsp:Transcript_31534/g.36786  ORF Transcript_31534/g.36786 Transcript_31534/m.36786 type:complete len:295 (+) Transcript_31534:68-952(+)